MSTLTAATLGGIALSFLCSAALAERTTYPLTIENCGKEVTFENGKPKIKQFKLPPKHPWKIGSDTFYFQRES